VKTPLALFRQATKLEKVVWMGGLADHGLTRSDSEYKTLQGEVRGAKSNILKPYFLLE
jgi:hypothetical protein